MLIFELFDKPAEITYTKIQPNDVIAAFRVGDIDYMFQAVSYGDFQYKEQKGQYPDMRIRPDSADRHEP